MQSSNAASPLTKTTRLEILRYHGALKDMRVAGNKTGQECYARLDKVKHKCMRWECVRRWVFLAEEFARAHVSRMRWRVVNRGQIDWRLYESTGSQQYARGNMPQVKDIFVS